MKAMLVDENRKLVWSEVENPIIKDDEELVKNVWPKVESGAMILGENIFKIQYLLAFLLIAAGIYISNK